MAAPCTPSDIPSLCRKIHIWMADFTLSYLLCFKIGNQWGSECGLFAMDFDALRISYAGFGQEANGILKLTWFAALSCRTGKLVSTLARAYFWKTEHFQPGCLCFILVFWNLVVFQVEESFFMPDEFSLTLTKEGIPLSWFYVWSAVLDSVNGYCEELKAAMEFKNNLL